MAMPAAPTAATCPQLMLPSLLRRRAVVSVFDFLPFFGDEMASAFHCSGCSRDKEAKPSQA